MTPDGSRGLGSPKASPRFRARTKSFVSRSRELAPALAAQYQQVRERYVLDVPRGEGNTTVAPGYRLDPQAIYGRHAPLYLEIGSGRGEQIVSFASDHPELNFLAFEVWTPGIARLAVEAGKRGLENVKVIEADAQQALPTLLPAASVAEIWTFFPDPWRKTRHHKRRLVSAAFSEVVADLLEDGGIWRMATDWENYAEQMLEVMTADPDFAVATEDAEAMSPSSRGTQMSVPQGFSPRFSGRVRTHFELRGEAEGRPTWDLAAVRLPRQPDGPSPETEARKTGCHNSGDPGVNHRAEARTASVTEVGAGGETT